MCVGGKNDAIMTKRFQSCIHRKSPSADDGIVGTQIIIARLFIETNHESECDRIRGIEIIRNIEFARHPLARIRIRDKYLVDREIGLNNFATGRWVPAFYNMSGRLRTARFDSEMEKNKYKKDSDGLTHY